MTLEPGTLVLVWVVCCAMCDARKILPVDDPLAVMQKSDWLFRSERWYCPICAREP